MLTHATTFISVVRRQADTQPQRQAYTFLADGETQTAHLTYAELDQRARTIAAILQAAGKPGDRVLLLYPPGLDYIAAFLACLYAGMVAVPAYAPGPTHLGRRDRALSKRLFAIIEDARPSLGLTTSVLLNRINSQQQSLPEMQTVDWLTAEQLPMEYADRWNEPPVRAESIAMLQYTSGSTGLPRGVILTHSNLLHNSAFIQQAFGQTPESQGVIWLPPYHDMGLIGGILQPLYTGFPVVLMSPVAFLQQPIRWLQAISDYRATTSGGPDFAYDLCVNKITEEQKASLDLQSWQVAFNGAEPIRHQTLERFAQAFASCGFRRQALHPCYGLAEATLLVSSCQPGSAPTIQSFVASALEQNKALLAEDNIQHNVRTYVSCGTIPGETGVRIVNHQTQSICQAGEIGEIWVAGPHIAQGYWQRAEETQHTFQARLADEPDKCFLRTGDLGFLLNQELFITGRLKDLIIIRGQNHYPQDIEQTVEQSHPALRANSSAAFTVRQTESDEEKLIIVQELERQHQRENVVHITETIRKVVAEKHELQVHTIVLIKTGSIPKTSSGKIQRRSCQALFEAGELEVIYSETQQVPPLQAASSNTFGQQPENLLLLAPNIQRTQLIAQLTNMLAQALRIDPAVIRKEQSLSTLGLDSLLMIELSHNIEMHWGVSLPLADLWQHIGIDTLADSILDALKTQQANQSLRPEDCEVSKEETFSAPFEREDSLLPLTYGQRGLYFLQQMAPASSAYHIAIPLRITSAIDVAALQRAFTKLVERHPVLNSTFQIHQSQPVQRIHTHITFDFRHEQVQDTPAGLRQRLSAEAQRPIDLANGPLLRLLLLSLHSQEHILLLATHHIVLDFWSLVVMARDLGELYTAEKSQQIPLLTTPPVAYRTFVSWQQKVLEGSEGEQHLAYWQQQLAGDLPSLNLPIANSRPPVQTQQGAAAHYSIDAQLTYHLKTLAQEQQVSLFMLLLSAFYVMLHRYTEQEDILVGSPVTGRSSHTFANLVGYLANTVVLRANLSGNPSFLSLLQQVKRTTLEALTHQDYPFTLLVEHVQPERDLSRSPLFQVMFILQKAHLFDEKLALFALGQEGQALELGGLTIEPYALPQQAAQFDLTLMVAEIEGRLLTTWQYNTDLFVPSAIEQLNRHFQTLLRGIAHNPRQNILQIPLMSQEEQTSFLQKWQNPDHNSTPSSFLQSFKEQVNNQPDAVAVLAGMHQLTYMHLSQLANQLAHYLQQQGVRAETFVGVYLPRTSDMIIALLAILKAGGTIVSLDPTYPQERLVIMAEDANLHYLITHEARLQTSVLRQGQPCIICLDQQRDRIAQQSSTNLDEHITDQHLAYLIYTSGSTGRPKGAMLPMRSFNNMISWQTIHADLKVGEKTLQYTSLNFDVSLQEIFPTLSSGGTIVMINEEQHLDPVALLQLIDMSGTQRVYLPPAILQYLAETAQHLQIFPKQLHTIIVAGDQLKITQQIKHFFQKLKGCRFDNQCGPSETHVATAFTFTDEPENWPFLPPIGRTITNVCIYLLDAWMQPVPQGAIGEIYISGAGLGRGYLHRPELTAEKFRPNPFSNEAGARLYKTGDLAHYQNDGNIAFLGRSDHQIKIRGVRIELGEIEVRLNQHPAIRESIVTLTQQNDGYLVAYIVTQPATQVPSIEQLRSFLKNSLVEQMIPSAFIFLEALPLSINGKIDRAALPQPAATRPHLTSAYALPQTAIEQAIASIWSTILQLETPGIHDNFFDSGGHSLLIMEMQRQLFQVMGYNIPIVDLFKYPTISSLAEHISKSNMPQSATAPISQKKSIPPSQSGQDIAIIGIAGRFPGSPNLQAFWQHLCAGDEMITRFSDEELKTNGIPESLRHNPNYVKAGAILENADLFAASFFGFNAREAEMMDPQQRIFLECAWEALENAAYDPERYPGEIGVFAGASMNTYLFFNLSSNMDLIHQIGEYQTMLGNDKDFLATRVSYKLNLKGPGVTVQTACSTSLVAVHMACRSLRDQECDIALAGGVAIRFPQTAGYLYQEGGILSPDGHCRAFSQEAQGTVPGSGVGAVVLKPLAKAIADGDHIYAVIKGSAINNDGSLKAGYTAPSVEGQAKAITSALAHASIAPETISYIETHGTGTHLGDPIEIAALSEAYRHPTQTQTSCAIGSLKTNIGHADTAAGIAGLLKVILALQHQLIPPTLHYSQANPQIDFAHSPFYVNTALTPWTTDHLPRRAGISSLGIGGTNAHVIIEQAPEHPTTTAPWPWQILPLSAKTEQELETLLSNFQAHLEHLPEESNMADIAYTLQVGRKEFAKRCVLLCREDAQDVLHALADRATERLFLSVSEPCKKAIVFLFPGQGTQYVDMTRELYATIAFFRKQIDQCAALLLPHLGIDIRTILYPDQDASMVSALLEQTHLTQPAIFVVEYALAMLLRHWQIEPYALIGHSIGEYVAACLAGIFSLEDALQLVTLRGKLIQQLPHGSMLSVHLSEQAASALLIDYHELSLAAINSSTLSTISGSDEAITRLEQELLTRQTPYRRLHTSHAFHSAMMDDILDSFRAAVSKIPLHAPCIACISNVTGTWITSEQATDPHYWVKHLRQTVRFADGLAELQKLPDSIYLEVGPGHSLSTFLRQESQKRCISLTTLPHPQEKQPELAVFLKALGKIWLAGVPIDWQAYWEGTTRRRVPLPTYPLTRQRYLVTPQQRESSQAFSSAPERKESDINKWFYLPTWHQTPQPDTTHLQDQLNSDKQQLWLIFSNECSIAEQMTTRLEQAGQELLIVKAGSRFARLEASHYTINPTRREDYNALLQTIRQAGQHIQRIIHAWTLTNTPQTSDFTTMQDLGYYSLLYLAQALEQTETDNAFTALHPLPIELISNYLYALTELEPLDPHKATLLGPCKVIPQEHPEIRCRCFDITLPPTGSQQERALSEQLLTEITSESSDPLIALRGRQRWLQSATRITPANTATPVRHQGVYLITGGLGSLGLTIATHLSRHYQANLVLLGRGGLPARENWSDWLTTHDTHDVTTSKIQQIQALEQFGSRVLLISADVANKQQMSHAMQQIEQHFGTLHGVIHTAGVTRGDSIYRPLTEITRPLSEEQFQAKVQGLFVLEELLHTKSLDFCLLFSSNAATLGGLGLAAYSAANLFMNAFAKEHNARERTPWLSINWDGWEQAASKQELQQYSGFSGGIERYTMTAEEGIQAFERALTLLSFNELIISTSDFTTRLDRWVKHKQSVRATRLEQPAYERPLPQSTYHEPRNEIERSIVNIWEFLLGVTPIGIDDNFFELGGHSLLATQFTTRMQETFGIKFPLQGLFETPTVAGLAERTVQELASQIDETLLKQIEQFTASEAETSP